LKQMKITMGNSANRTICLLTGLVEGDWKFPEYININVISEDRTEAMKQYELNQNRGVPDKKTVFILRIITRLLQQLGIPANIRGFYYLREAIYLTLCDSSMVESITKKMYPAVAEAYNTAPFCVERTIRYAIETAWKRGHLETMEELFGYTVLDKKGKPTNSEFIAMVADQIRLRHLFQCEIGPR